MTHDSEMTEINGKKRDIDKEMIPLIQELNRLGLQTTNCCQGDKNHNAYVSIQLGTNSGFHYQIEEKVLTIRWKLPEHQEESATTKSANTSYIDTNIGNWELSEVLPILEREQKARFGNLPYKYKVGRAEIITVYLDAESKMSRAGYVSVDELYLRLKNKYHLSVDDFRATMIEFYDHNRNEFSFSSGSCIRAEVRKYGFPAGGKWIYYIQKFRR